MVRCAGVSMDKKKLVRKVQTAKTFKEFSSSVIVTYIAVLFTSSTVQLAGSGITVFGILVESPAYVTHKLLFQTEQYASTTG